MTTRLLPALTLPFMLVACGSNPPALTGTDLDGGDGSEDGSALGSGPGGGTAGGGAAGGGAASGGASRGGAAGGGASGGTTAAGGSAAGTSGSGGSVGSATGGTSGAGGVRLDGGSPMTGAAGASMGGATGAPGGSAGNGGSSPAATGAGLDNRPANPTCVAFLRSAPPASLKATGCVDPANPLRPSAGLIPYGVNSPLWSDGAEKDRWMGVPDGTKVKWTATTAWEFPVGTVLVKNFSLGGRRIETRLFVRHPEGWAGYSYEWNDAQTDALLLPDDKKNKVIGAQTWTFPDRKDCLKCHTQGAGFVLGTETGQLNGDFTYPNGRRANQLTTLAQIGLFDVPLPGAPDTQLRFPTPLSQEGTVETRARSYLHANCAGCHRPGGGAKDISLDLRYTVPFPLMRLCGARPQEFKELGPIIFAPGSPMTSSIVQHMRTLMKGRMPPLASNVVDEAGTQVIEAWIRSVTACP